MNIVEYVQKYLEYLSRESKYSHLGSVKTYQDWKENHLEINTHFTNAVS